MKLMRTCRWYKTYRLTVHPPLNLFGIDLRVTDVYIQNEMLRTHVSLLFGRFLLPFRLIHDKVQVADTCNEIGSVSNGTVGISFQLILS